ncbi:MAG: hypothetical protein LPK26_04725 [Bacillaceae bacterium]|nr:hypothetical protein [Bacillaceae bacterium]
MFKKLNLQFFSEESNNQGGDDSQNQDNQNQGNDNSGDDSSKSGNQSIPYDRFQSVVQEKNQYKQQLENLLKQQQDDETEAKKKQGEFESLYNDLKSKHDPLSEQFKQYQETFKSILTTKLEAVPEEFKDLIPQGNELEQLKWLENAESKGLFKKDNPQSFGNNGDNPNNQDNKQKKGFLKSLSRF